MLSVRYGKHWSSDVAGLLDYRLEKGTLTVMLDHGALVAARKVVSVTTCTWALDGRLYETRATAVLPAEGVMRVTAREKSG